MNKDIKIGSRYGHQHTLKYSPEEGENAYRFVPAEEWMPIYCSYGKWDEDAEENDLSSIDSDGGPYLTVGSVVDGKEIHRIYEKKNAGYFLIIE
jgi:hypothetical protein